MKTPFKISYQDGNARSGTFQTSHGEFPTPNFMPVGTRASVKGVDVERLGEAGADIMLVNTYHLWLRPGPELIERFGGIHKFTNWGKSILSDSGGYQVFSLKSIRQISEKGVEFRSHLDGKKLFLNPEKSIEIQEALGVDIAMVLDECPSSELSYEDVKRSLEMTLRWARRSYLARRKDNTLLFGITQGGIFRDLRSIAAEEINKMNFDGHAIGGLSVGEEKGLTYDVLSYHVKELDPQKIRYLMGVGTPADIVQAVSQGVDLFDCVMPTRAGRFGRAFVGGDEPFINIRNSRYAEDEIPLDAACSCVACRNYSRAYINHLFKVGEMLGPQLMSVHNLSHYFSLMRRIRAAIEGSSFAELHKAERKRWENGNRSRLLFE